MIIENNWWKVPLTPMGSSLHVSVHAWHGRSATIDNRHERKFVICNHTCLQTDPKTSPPTPQPSFAKFQNPRTTFEKNWMHKVGILLLFCKVSEHWDNFSNFYPKIKHGTWGLFLGQILIFCDLWTHAKFQN